MSRICAKCGGPWPCPLCGMKPQDEFTDLPVAASLKSALRRIKRGVCSVAGCERPLRTKWNCAKHSTTVRKYARVVESKMKKIRVPVKFP